MPEVTSPIFYLAGDLSGIQRFVLRVKTAGKAQAKRLRARSFLLELLEHAALWTVQQRFAVAEEDILVRGGGGFLVRVSSAIDVTRLDQLSAHLQRRLWDEFGGQIQLSLGWGSTPMAARSLLEQQKRKPGASVLQHDGRWDSQRWSHPPLDTPCEVCRESAGVQMVQDEDEAALHCRSCLQARKIGQELTRRAWIRAGHGPLRVLDVPFELLESRRPGAWRVGRWIPRHPQSDSPLTFEDLSRRSRGDSRLAVLKADVDDMGVRVGETADADPTLQRLRSFSRDLHEFFSDHMQDLMEQKWPLVYTLYAGGDDLLLIGPWDVMLDFAGALAKAFRAGPVRTHDRLTMSAGVALTPYRVPIRHAVERSEELLESAKGQPGKNRCAALGGDWTWERHDEVITRGKMIADSVDRGGIARGLLHRLLHLAETVEPKERALRAARWSYQIGRNVSHHSETAEFRRWALGAVAHLEDDALIIRAENRRRAEAQDAVAHLEDGAQRVSESAASLRYALLATRMKAGGGTG